MPLSQYLLCSRTAQHLNNMIDAENLVGSCDAREEFLCRRGEVNPFSLSLETVVAHPAVVGFVRLPEVSQQPATTAILRGRTIHQGVQTPLPTLTLRRRALVEEVLNCADISIAEQHQTIRPKPVPSGLTRRIPDEADGSGAAVHLDEGTVGDAGGRALDADHGRDAQLAADDRGVREDAASLDDEAARRDHEEHPAGVGHRRDQDLALDPQAALRRAGDERLRACGAGAAAGAPKDVFVPLLRVAVGRRTYALPSVTISSRGVKGRRFLGENNERKKGRFCGRF